MKTLNNILISNLSRETERERNEYESQQRVFFIYALFALAIVRDERVATFWREKCETHSAKYTGAQLSSGTTSGQRDGVWLGEKRPRKRTK